MDTISCPSVLYYLTINDQRRDKPGVPDWLGQAGALLDGGAMGILICPNCGKLLREEPKTFVCPAGHSFDRAKSGYVNLLMPGSKHSAQPGDDKRMVEARSAFLNAGYYQPLLAAVTESACRHLPLQNGVSLLDAGCGEGYYTAGVDQALREKGLDPQITGVDISKLAVNKAAKRCKNLTLAVASVFHLPVKTESCDLFLNLFAPFCLPEILRTLKPEGKLLLVIPGERHLWELKQAVYDDPYLNQVKDFGIEGMELLEQKELSWHMEVNRSEDIDHLFQMTPYYYKTSQEGYHRLLSLPSLRTSVQFHLLVYRKQPGGF